MNTNSKYIAIKVRGIDHWLWFDRTKTSTSDGMFTGNDGWGAGGAHTEICVAENYIEGRISSESPQYRSH